MLANLLPGLRDLRGPLSAGYLWLAVAWILLVDRLPQSPADAPGLVGEIYGLGGAAGTTYVVAALSFTAYLVGALSTGVLNPAIRYLLGFTKAAVARTPDRHRRLAMTSALSTRNYRRLHTLVLEACTEAWSKGQPIDPEEIGGRLGDPQAEAVSDWYRHTWGRHFPDTEPHLRDPDNLREAWKYPEVKYRATYTVIDTEQHADDLVQELRLVPEKLVGDRPAAFDRYDRLRAEGEFRLAVTPPLLGIIAATAIQRLFPWPVLVPLVAAVVVIMAQGLRKEADAVAQLIQSIEAGYPTSAALEQIARGEVYWRGHPEPGPEDDPMPADADSPLATTPVAVEPGHDLAT